MHRRGLARTLGLSVGAVVAHGVLAPRSAYAAEPQPLSFSNIAELRAGLNAPSPSAGQTAMVFGFYGPNDGGGGVFYWDSSSTAPDNNGTIIVPDAAPATGRWLRLLEDPAVIHLAWFGATTTAPSGGPSPGVLNYNALKSALLALSPAMGGTLLVGDFYDVGYADWPGIGIGPIDNGALSPTIHRLSIVGTRPGAGFRFNSLVHPGFVSCALKFSGCQSLQLRGLTLDGGGLATGLLYMRTCQSALIVENVFTNTSGVGTYCLQAVMGTGNRFEGNTFESCCGNVIGYVSYDGAHEEGAQVIGNRFNNSNTYAQLYVAIRNGAIADNVFSNTQSNGALNLLADGLPAEVCENLTITGNSFKNVAFAIRSDPTASQGPTVPMRNISVVGNTIDGTQSGGAGIGIYPCIGLTVCGNSIKDCASNAIQLLGVQGATVSGNDIEWTNATAPEQAWAVFLSAGFGEMRNVLFDGNTIRGYSYGVAVCSTVDYSTPGYPLVTLCSGVTISNNQIDVATYGILVTDRVENTTIHRNRVTCSAWACQIVSTCKISDNDMAAPLVNRQTDPNATYYALENTQKIFCPSPAPPTNPPDGVPWSVGDFVYHSSPTSGAPMGWVYTSEGWRAFGLIAS